MLLEEYLEMNAIFFAPIGGGDIVVVVVPEVVEVLDVVLDEVVDVVVIVGHEVPPLQLPLEE
jgi:hypothetical protein